MSEIIDYVHEICPECESDDIFDHGEAENKRTYDDKQHVYECEECGNLWKE